MSSAFIFAPPAENRLLLVRHPETIGNSMRQYVGSTESPLSPLGEEQAHRAITGLIAAGPDRIVSSPLGRCRFIADAVAEQLGLEVQVDPRLREMDFGPIEGMTFDEIQAAGIRMTWDADKATHPLEGAESFLGFAQRLEDARGDLEQLGGTTAVISHGGVIRRLTMAWFQIPMSSMWNLRVENVSTAVVSILDGSPILERWGLVPEDLPGLRL